MGWGDILNTVVTGVGAYLDYDRASEQQANSDALNREYIALVKSQMDADRELREEILGDLNLWDSELRSIYERNPAFRTEVDAESNERVRANLDRAQGQIDRSMSQRRADRISRGVDLSTADLASLKSENEAAANIMRDARADAKDSALRYVGGLRGAELSEVGSVFGATPAAKSSLLGAGFNASGLSTPAYLAYQGASDAAASAGSSFNAFGQAFNDMIREWDTSWGSSQNRSKG